MQVSIIETFRRDCFPFLIYNTYNICMVNFIYNICMVNFIYNKLYRRNGASMCNSDERYPKDIKKLSNEDCLFIFTNVTLV
jgi:hypothetical protein